MNYKINQDRLDECLRIMEIQYKKMECCYGELEHLCCGGDNENKGLREILKDMEEQLEEIWKLRRILERIFVNGKRRENRILEQLEGIQRRKNFITIEKIDFGYLSEILEDLQI